MELTYKLKEGNYIFVGSKTFSEPQFPESTFQIGNAHTRQTTKKTEESYLLGYNTVQYVESQPTFRRNMSPHLQG
jgi:hypothetical protein